MLRRFKQSAVAGLVVLALGGCQTRNLEGPQLLDVPPDFGLDRQAQSRRTVLEELPLLQRLGYFLRGNEGTASVLLTEFEGGISQSELEEIRSERAEQWARSGVLFGELDRQQIDNHDAWLWFERGSRSRRLVGVISYPEDNRVWTVDFYASVERFQDDDLMERHVTSFVRNPAADERGPVLAGFFFFFAVLIFVAWIFRRDRQHRRVRKM